MIPTLALWWYLALLTLSIVAGVVDDRIAGNHPWHVAADVACGISLLLFVIAWWVASVNQFVGAILPILLVLAVAWEVFALIRDYRHITGGMAADDPTRLWVRLRLAMYGLTIAPAYVCGAMSAARFYGAI